VVEGGGVVALDLVRVIGVKEGGVGFSWLGAAVIFGDFVGFGLIVVIVIVIAIAVAVAVVIVPSFGGFEGYINGRYAVECEFEEEGQIGEDWFCDGVR